MLPFPEFGTMPSLAAAVLPAPEVAATGGGFASALQAMFERAGMDGEAQVGDVAVGEVEAGDVSWGNEACDAMKAVRPATVEAQPEEGGEQRVVAESPMAGLWARLERVEPVSVETAGRGQEDAQGKRVVGSRHDESTDPLASEARVTEAGTDQEQSWTPLPEGVEAERAPGNNPGRVETGQRVELHPPATQDLLPEGEPQSQARSQKVGSHEEARVELHPSATQDQLPEGEPQSQARLKGLGSPKQASVEAERSSGWNAGRPVGPDSESGLATTAVRRNAGDVEVRPAVRAKVTEETQDPLESRRRAEQRSRPPAGLVELKRPEIWGSVAKNGTEEDPVAFSLKAGIRGERPEGWPDNGRGEEQAVGKLTEVERLADGSAEGERPGGRFRREGAERLEVNRPATGIVRDRGDAREHGDPGSRGGRVMEARAEVKNGDTTAPARPVTERASGPILRGVETGGNAGELVAASTLGGRIEGQVNVKQAPVAAPASPPIRVETAVDELQEARGAIREIRMTVEPEGGKPIRLRFTESGGQVEVTARSGDPATAAALRAELSGLRSLGYETTRGVGGSAGPELAAKPEAESGRSGEGGSKESPGHGNAGAGDASREHKGRNAARWLEAFDRQRDGEWRWNKGEKQ